MKYKILKYSIGILIIIINLVFFAFYYDFRANLTFDLSTFLLLRMYILLILNFSFLSFIFLIDKKIYLGFFIILVSIGLSSWILKYTQSYFLSIKTTIDFDVLTDLIILSMYNIFAPGIILITIYYIHNLTPKITGNILGKYHIHESFFGLILLLNSFILFLLRSFLASFKIFWEDLKIFLGFSNVSLFIFLYFGFFFIARDINDVINLKFIEKRDFNVDNDEEKLQKNNLFRSISIEDLQFFKKPIIILYPVGMFLTTISFQMVIYGSNFLVYEIFQILYNDVVLIGYLLCCLSGLLIGFDWFRLFKLFYPHPYYKIMEQIEELKAGKKEKHVL